MNGYIPPEDSLIEYPCDFPIKAMCLNAENLLPVLAEVIQVNDPKFSEQSMTTRLSGSGKYVGVTCQVYATSREQLDAIYQSLFDHDLVKMVL